PIVGPDGVALAFGRSGGRPTRPPPITIASVVAAPIAKPAMTGPRCRIWPPYRAFPPRMTPGSSGLWRSATPSPAVASLHHGRREPLRLTCGPCDATKPCPRIGIEARPRPSPAGPLRSARTGSSASKGHPPRDLPRPREPAIERRQPDPPEAAAGGPGDRSGDGRPV